MYNTKIGEFCATNSNWEELLAAEPYSIRIKKDDGFVIFNYNMLSSDFNTDIVKEARGIIFREGEWESPVCHAFDKFFNYGEPNCATLDWSSVVVSEKIDGSIMKLWNYEGEWHLSTNGTIDASTAAIGDCRKDSFAQIFWEACTEHITKYYDVGISISDWLHELDTSFTYIFELVSPYTRVVIPYEYSNIYFIGARNNKTNYQFGCDEVFAKICHTEMFPRPKIYPMRTRGQILDAADDLPWDEEGYVCYDKNFNRCKIKSPKYVLAHYTRNNNVVTQQRLIDIILSGEESEFLTYASDYSEQLNKVKQLMNDFTYTLDVVALLTRNLRKLTRAQAAEVIKSFHPLVQHTMFINLDRHVGGRECVREWDKYKWERTLEYFMEFIGSDKSGT